MGRFERFFSIMPAGSLEASAATYVPLVVSSRALSFIRMQLVAKILGDAGLREFGIYQPALELINLLVPLVMFGLGDVAERYAARFIRDGRLGWWIRRQLARLAGVGAAVIVILLAVSPWLAKAVFKLNGAEHSAGYGILLVGACAGVILLLAVYQYMAAVLRGLRAYAASAGMEFLSASLFLVLACVAAWRGGALGLIYMYGVSVLVPVIYYGTMLAGYVKALPAAATPAPAEEHPGLNRFAAWALVRLMLMMVFGFLSVWGVGHLAINDPHAHTAGYAVPYRIAQLLASVGLTLWASTYGLSAKAWSHGQARRAQVQLFRMGKFGAVVLTLLALGLLFSRGLFAALLPMYAGPIMVLLPPLLAVFLWYGMLAFASMYGDLQEKPQLGALLWGAAVMGQGLLIFIRPEVAVDPGQQVLMASAVGLGFAVLVFAPLILWHPFRLTATSVPLVLLSLAPLSLFSPAWVVDVLAPLVMLGALGFLWVTGLLIRPIDRRAWRRFRHGMSVLPEVGEK